MGEMLQLTQCKSSEDTCIGVTRILVWLQARGHVGVWATWRTGVLAACFPRPRGNSRLSPNPSSLEKAKGDVACQP